MARNVAQIVFLLYGFFLLRQIRKGIRRLLLRNVREEDYYRNRKSFWRALLFLPFQADLPPLLFYLHSAATFLIPLTLFFSLVLGWFSFLELPLKIAVALSLITGAAAASLVNGINNRKEKGRGFIWFRPTSSEDSDEKWPFISSVLDLSVTALLPLVMALSNFTL